MSLVIRGEVGGEWALRGSREDKRALRIAFRDQEVFVNASK